MPDANPGGPGGKRGKIPHNAPQGKTSHRAGKKKCCHMVEAGRAVKRGEFRLAARHARMGARLIAARALA
jgi:hypothetical protein